MSETQDCPYCFRTIKTKSSFCKFCGSTLKHCSECSAINKEDVSYCSECGTNIKDVEVPKSYRKEKEGKLSEKDREELQELIEERGLPKKQPQLVLWPPIAGTRNQSQFRPRARSLIQTEYLDQESTYQPADLQYTYNKVKALGFLGGSLPTSNVLGSIVEAF